MASVIRFHLDEHLGNNLARALRRAGIDITTTVEAGLLTRPDEEQLAFALREQRILVTHDQDFLRLAAQGTPHAGIAFCLQARTLSQIIEGLMLIHGVYSAEEMFDQVEFI